MAWWQILVGILLFIVALGVLIGIHELGHLSAAKMFHVYCFNYSIGFGPKLLSTKRTKKHETIWTLRAIPLGGFVSMYGEGTELDTDEYIPPNRSLEGIARYKRAIIISAGVFLNFILGFVLIFIHNAAFDQISFSFPRINNYETVMVCNVNKDIKMQGIESGDGLKLQMDPLAGVFYIKDNITIPNAGSDYVLCMSNIVTTTKIDPLLSNSLVIYQPKSIVDTIKDSIKAGYTNESLASYIKANGDPRSLQEILIDVIKMNKTKKDEKYTTEVTTYYENVGIPTSVNLDKQYNVSQNTGDINVDFTFYKPDKTLRGTVPVVLKQNGFGGFKDTGIYLKRFFYHYTASESFQVSWNEWCNANTAVFRGIGMLFTGQGDVSGPIGIAKMSTTVLANFGFERYLYLWGMISCNLAILNLLPFPGLDGWALVVIGYEAITKKQIPTKVKGIISVIGLGLLFLLMIFIIIKDIMGLII